MKHKFNLSINKRIFKIFKIIIPLIFIILLLGFTKLPWLLSAPLLLNEELHPSDVIVVLYSGYGEIVQDGLDQYSIDRVQKAVDVWKKGWAPYLLLSGGAAEHRLNPLPGANRMALKAQNLGVPFQYIIIENQSKDTRYNAKNSDCILKSHKWNKIILVTNDFHIKRAKYLFEQYNIIVHPAPIIWKQNGRWNSNWKFINLVFKEIVARCMYFLLDNDQIDGIIEFLRPDKGPFNR